MNTWDFRPGPWQALWQAALDRLGQEQIVERIWRGDHTVWSGRPDEITNRMGWLDIHARMRPEAAALQQWADQMYGQGFRQVVLIGMGGSSLAPEVFRQILGPEGDRPGMEMHILDTTDPVQIVALESRLDLASTLFLVATKSGGTVETLSGYRYFQARVVQSRTGQPAGQHFVAITDPGSSLVDMARQAGFQCIFENDPDIGGRYSALSHFGLVPLALLGADIDRLLEPVAAGAAQARQAGVGHDAVRLGALMAGLAAQGRDKLTLMMPTALSALGDWLEQLVAESLGKAGKGIVPVLGETLDDAPFLDDDRFCVVLLPAYRPESETPAWAGLAEICAQAGHPTVTMPLQTPWDLGQFLFHWEFAVAVAGHCMAVHPFDQPDVEAAKVSARAFVAHYERNGALPAGAMETADADRLADFVAQAQAGDYLAIQAYLPQEKAVCRELQALRTALSHRTRRAVTIGFGPRFLHSTGQLHKGGAGNGLYLQLVRDSDRDMAIPAPEPAGSSLSFGTLQRAQALGDAEALRNRERRLLCLNLGDDPVAALQALVP